MDKKQRAPISHSARRLRRERLVAKYHRSDLSQSDFALKHGISLSTLQLWLRKSRSTESESGLADSVENAQDRRWIEPGVQQEEVETEIEQPESEKRVSRCGKRRLSTLSKAPASLRRVEEIICCEDKDWQCEKCGEQKALINYADIFDTQNQIHFTCFRLPVFPSYCLIA